MLPKPAELRERPAGTTPAQRWVLALASLASFLVVLDMLVVATALTAIRRHLGASLADLEWTVNAYTLSFAVLLMTAATLGDRLGRRRVFAAGPAPLPPAPGGGGPPPRTARARAPRAAPGGDDADRARAAQRRLSGRATRLGHRDLRQRDRARRGARPGPRRGGHPRTRLAVDFLAERPDRVRRDPAAARPRR